MLCNKEKFKTISINHPKPKKNILIKLHQNNKPKNPTIKNKLNIFKYLNIDSQNKNNDTAKKPHTIKTLIKSTSASSCSNTKHLKNKTRKFTASKSKKTISYMTPKIIHINKSTELLKPTKQIPIPKNKLYNKKSIYSTEQTTINYIINSIKNSSKKNDYKLYFNCCHSIKNSNTKDIFFNHPKDNHLKVSTNGTNNTNSTSNNSNNVNSNNNNSNPNFEELLKENEKLKKYIENFEIENKKYVNKINDLNKKNIDLHQKFYELKHQNEEYSKSISQSLKLLNFLKKNGLELSQIIDDESFEDDDDIFPLNDKNNFSYNLEKENKRSNEKEFTEISYGQLEYHDEFSASKVSIINKNIPRLKISDIKLK